MKEIKTVNHPVVLVENIEDHELLIDKWHAFDSLPPSSYPAFALCEYSISVDYLYPSDLVNMKAVLEEA